MDEQIPQSQNEPSAIPFDELTEALLDSDTTLAPRYLFRLSGIEGDELSKLDQIWLDISASRRKGLIEDLSAFAETNSLLSYENVFKLGLIDKKSDIRTIAILALWECGEPDLIPTFLEILENDEDSSTQAQAASGLGHYVYMGELEELKPEIYENIISKLLGVMDSEADPPIRRSALESLGFSSHPKLPSLIEDAYDYGDEDWLTSALIAMGRSANEQWNPMVMVKLDHVDAKVRLRAAESAGELNIQAASPILIHLLNNEDEEVQFAAVWALSEVGGIDARVALESLLEQTEDEEAIELIETAIDNLAYNEELQDFNILDLSDNDLATLTGDNTTED